MDRVLVDDIDVLIRNTVEQMSSLQLMQEAGYSAGQNVMETEEKRSPKEGAYQHHFLAALSRCVPVNVDIVSEKAVLSGYKRGSVDFFIDSNYRYGIELTRDGSDLLGHIGRFHAVKGKYRGLQLKQWRVVDFRFSNVTLKVSPAELENTVVVWMLKEFQYAKIEVFKGRNPNRAAPDTVETVKLRG